MVTDHSESIDHAHTLWTSNTSAKLRAVFGICADFVQNAPEPALFGACGTSALLHRASFTPTSNNHHVRLLNAFPLLKLLEMKYDEISLPK